MTVIAGALLIIAVAASVAAPLLGRDAAADIVPADAAEVLEREKGVALLAIREADFDLAMGKLSEEDYGKLRTVYEERALGALGKLDALEREAPAAAASKSDGAAFCTACGARFQSKDRFCAACGSARAATG